MSHETTRRTFLRRGAVALAAGLAGCSGAVSAPNSDTTTTPTEPEPQATTQTQTAGNVYTQVYRETIPSVVLVRANQSQGTGFVFDESHVVTNAHVVGSASSTQIRFSDNTWASGSVRGVDYHSDLAAITVEDIPTSAQPLSLAAQPPVIGQEVVAIGNPYNLNGSITAGIVSGLDRLIPSPAGYRIPDAIQTDAAVNPGNSGGPLMSLDNDVVGVVNSKQGDNIAFGISAALTRRVVPSLIESGSYEHAYMGVSLDTVTPTIARANDMDRPRGLLVLQTVPGGPADGVLRQSVLEYVNGQRVPVGGDVILSVENTQMDTFEDLASYLALETRPGDTIQLTVLRDGTEETVDLELADRPEQSESPLR